MLISVNSVWESKVSLAERFAAADGIFRPLLSKGYFVKDTESSWI